MNRDARKMFAVQGIVVLLLVASACGCNGGGKPAKFVSTGGNYGPVTRDMLIGATFTHATGRDRRSDELTWTFSEDGFEIQAGPQGFSPEFCERLLPPGQTADRITGKWSLAEDIITFTQIAADGSPTNQEPRRLETMFTGVLRVVADRQYVFSRARR